MSNHVKRVSSIALASVLLLTVTASVRAQATDAAVTPFINADTTGIVAADLASVNLDAVQQWVDKMMVQGGMSKEQIDQSHQESKEQMDQAKDWIGKFTKAGGKRIYVVVTLSTLMKGAPGFLVVPTDGGNADAISKMLSAGAGADSGNETATVGNVVLFGPKASVDAAKTPAPAARPELTKALAATGTGTLRIAFAGKGAKDLPPMVPGGKEVAEQSQNIDWGSLSLTLPPNEGIKVDVEAKDAESAKKILDTINGGLAQMKDDPQAKKALGNDVNTLATALTPKQTGNQITITLDRATIEKIVPLAIKEKAAEDKAEANKPATEK